jgi:hypothetical protein
MSVTLTASHTLMSVPVLGLNDPAPRDLISSAEREAEAAKRDAEEAVAREQRSAEVGPGRYPSPRHRMPCNSSNEGP